MPALNALDFCVIVFFTLVLYFSCKAEFFLSIFNMASAVAAFFLASAIRPYLNGFITFSNLNGHVLSVINKYEFFKGESVKQFAAERVTGYLHGGAVGVALFFILSFILRGLRKTVRTLSRFFILRTVDKAAAVVFGVITGIVILRLMFAAVLLFFPNYYAAIDEQVKTSAILNYGLLWIDK